MELEYLGYGGTRISRIWFNYDIWDMVVLDICEMVELGYLGYGGTRISRILWN